jgi:CheY-like chemotaxis protein/HPt (histidine-containing phosphotransfer) domain-containing protein
MQTSVSPTSQILVVDDDEVMREVLSLLLEASGRRVLTADSGTVALALLATLAPEQCPDVILTDMKMPGLSKDALALQLRLACPPPTLLVAMSGSKPARGEAVGFDAFLLKPFTVADLDAAVERSRHSAAGAQSAPPADVRKGKKAPIRVLDEVLNETVYTKLSAMMGASLSQFYSMLLEDVLVRVERMRSATATHDEATLVREAHAIKGSCGMLGAMELQTLAGRIEAGGLSGSSLINNFGPAVERLRRMLDKQAGQTG